MKHVYRRTVAVILSLALVLALMPFSAIQKASAATVYFSNLSVSTSSTNPKMVTTKYLDLSGTFHPDISPTTITFKIETMVNGKLLPAPSGTVVPKATISGNTFTFKSIELSSGLNKITIMGINSAGQQVSTGDTDSGYVYYANVPTIYDIKLMDGTTYDSTVYVDGSSSNMLNFSFRAPNSDQTSINGVAGMRISGDQWYASIPLNKGTNDISIVASNNTQSFTANRKAVLFYGQATFGITVGPKASSATPNPNPAQPILEDDPGLPINTVFQADTATNTLKSIKGNVIVPASSTPSVTLELFDVTNPAVPSSMGTETISSLTFVGYVNGTANKIYSFDSVTLKNVPDLALGTKYQLRSRLTYNGTSYVDNTFTFLYRSASSIYIQDAYVLNDVTSSTGSYNFSYKEPITPGTAMDVREAPLYLGLALGNATGPQSVSVKVTPDGGTAQPAFTVTTVPTVKDSLQVVTIPAANLVNGMQSVSVTVGSGSDTKNYRINYISAPIVYFTNVAHGDVYKQTNVLTTSGITAKFVNFGSGEPSMNTTVYVNQIPLTHTFDPGTGILTTAGVTLQQGANTILLSTKGNGVPIELNITVFVFPDITAKILDPSPMNSGFTTASTTVKTLSPDKFTTSDRYVYFSLPYTDMNKIKVDIDGRDVFQGARPTGTTATFTYVDPSTNAADSTQKLQVVSTPTPTKSQLTLKLKESGTTVVTITGITLDGVSISRSFEVSREVPPYELVSPQLPQDRVINQNFWKVIIKAENADSVVFGKDIAQYTGTDTSGVAIYEYELKGLKAGKNTVKFSVNRSGKKVDGTFDIYYANQNVVGAQYKTQMKDTISAFNKDIEIKFPKNTILRDNTAVPDDETQMPDLVNQPQIRFGIANKDNGTVESKYSVPVIGKQWLIDNMDSQYIFSGSLYWVDGGYYNAMKPVDGLDPYETNPLNVSDTSLHFYSRTTKWLKPTNRGEITLKYDEGLRDVTQNLLTVWRFFYDVDKNMYRWENLGGVVNTSSKTIKAEFDGFGYYTVMMLRRGYPDVTNHGWARNYLETMYTKGVMNPKNSSMFGVDELITRGEFAQIMVKALDLPLDYDPANSTFWDVNVPSPYYDSRYIETAFRKGVVRGIAPGIFNPQGEITRQDAAVMIGRAINAKVGNDGEAARAALGKIFTDGTSADIYAAPSILAINKMGIVNGIPNTYDESQKNTFSFQPYAFLTRAEASKIAYKVMQYLKKLPK